MVILKGIWTFLLSLYPFMSLILFFLFFSFILLPSFRPPTVLNRLACTSGGGASLELIQRQRGPSHDVAHEAWQRPYSERPWTYSLRS